MIVGTCECTCRIPAAASFKDKRRVVKSVIARIRNKHNLAVAEADHQDRIQLATIGMSGVANSKRRVGRELNAALEL